jgi:hypothetical protein
MRLRLYYVSKKKYMLMPSLKSPFKVLLNVIKREGAISIRSGRRRRVQFVQSSFLTKRGCSVFALLPAMSAHCYWASVADIMTP